MIAASAGASWRPSLYCPVMDDISRSRDDIGTTADPTGQIGPQTKESYRILPGRADAGVVVACDHANNAFPPGYGTLGLPPEQLTRHIAYDIGAAEVTRRISDLLNAPAVMAHYSRLLIDPNRGLDDPTLIMRISDGAVVPGNRRLSEGEREKRVQLYYEPYHSALDEVLNQSIAAGVVPLLMSIHSFTESWRGRPRPWHAGILWDEDGRLALPLLNALKAEGDLVVGDNVPYTGRLKGDCMWRHGTMRGIAHCIVEIRQDLIRDEEGQRDWAERLTRLLVGLMNCPKFCADAQRIEFHVSNADITDQIHAPDGGARTQEVGR